MKSDMAWIIGGVVLALSACEPIPRTSQGETTVDHVAPLPESVLEDAPAATPTPPKPKKNVKRRANSGRISPNTGVGAKFVSSILARKGLSMRLYELVDPENAQAAQQVVSGDIVAGDELKSVLSALQGLKVDKNALSVMASNMEARVKASDLDDARMFQCLDKLGQIKENLQSQTPDIPALLRQLSEVDALSQVAKASTSED